MHLLLLMDNGTKHSDRKLHVCIWGKCTGSMQKKKQFSVISIPISKHSFGMSKSGWLIFTAAQSWQPFCLLEFGFSVWVIIMALITSQMASLIKTVSLLSLVCLCCLGVELLDCRVHVRQFPRGQTNEEEEEAGQETAVVPNSCWFCSSFLFVFCEGNTTISVKCTVNEEKHWI